MVELIVVSLVEFFHNFFAAIWIGGLIIMGFILIPIRKKDFGQSKEAKQFLKAVEGRLIILIYVSIGILAITGVLLSNLSPLYQGPLNITNEYTFVLTIKQVVFIFMIVIAIFRSKFIRIFKFNKETRQKLRFTLVYVNIVLGLLLIYLSSLVSVIGTIDI